ncbi:hypothetical protein ACIBQ0_39220, partial [Nocardia nova]
KTLVDPPHTPLPARSPDLFGCGREELTAVATAGTSNAYRSQPSPNSRPCGDPRCLCRAWSHTPTAHQRYGNPAEAWYAAWIGLSDYQLIHTPATDEHPALDGIKLRGNVVRKIDKIRDAAGPDAGQRTALDNLGMWLRMSRLMHGQGS